MLVQLGPDGRRVQPGRAAVNPKEVALAPADEVEGRRARATRAELTVDARNAATGGQISLVRSCWSTQSWIEDNLWGPGE